MTDNDNTAAIVTLLLLLVIIGGLSFFTGDSTAPAQCEQYVTQYGNECR